MIEYLPSEYISIKESIFPDNISYKILYLYIAWQIGLIRE